MTKNKNTRAYSNQGEINKLFNIDFDPELDNFDIIILLGYSKLSNTDKLAYLIINNLFKDDTIITPKLLLRLLRVSKKTVYKCINKLEAFSLIEKIGERIKPLLPNPKDESFKEAISLI